MCCFPGETPCTSVGRMLERVIGRCGPNHISRCDISLGSFCCKWVPCKGTERICTADTDESTGFTQWNRELAVDLTLFVAFWYDPLTQNERRHPWGDFSSSGQNAGFSLPKTKVNRSVCMALFPDALLYSLLFYGCSCFVLRYVFSFCCFFYCFLSLQK